MPIGLSLCLVFALACCCLTSAHATERTSFPSRALLEDDDKPLNANATSESAPTPTDDTSYTLVYACSGTCYAREPKPNGNETDRLTVSKTERERERERERLCTPARRGVAEENVERALFAPIPRAHPPALTPLPSSVQQ